MFTRRQLLKSASAALVGSLLPLAHAYTQSQQPAALRVRRDVTKMDASDPFFAQYAAAIKKMHELPVSDPRTWRNQAIIHANHCPHGMSDFLEWHRFYITFFETICGEMIGEPEFALPYWNWSNNGGRIPGPFFDQTSLNVEFLKDPSDYDTPAGSRSNWGHIDTIGTRALTASTGLRDDPRFDRIFSEEQIDILKRLSSYDLFHRRLEGNQHNNGHVLTGDPNGHMINGLSPLDPIFWLHHCNVDRIWAEWQAAGNATPANSIDYSGQFVDASGAPVNAKVTASDSHDHGAMGFTYDSLDTAPSTPRLRTAIPRNLITAPAQQEVVLGTLNNSEESAVNVATNLRVKTPTLQNEIFSGRTFRATSMLSSPRNAVEPSRLVAVLKGVSYPAVGDTRLIVNVFVNCPYLTPDTPSTDPHFADAFSFFGQPMKNMTNGGEFVVDITAPVRMLAGDGRLSSDEINVQLMPITPSSDGLAGPQFKVSSVNVLSI